jgi:hypothetical protein
MGYQFQLSFRGVPMGLQPTRVDENRLEAPLYN